MERYWVPRESIYDEEDHAGKPRDVEVVLAADAQATVETLQRELAYANECRTAAASMTDQLTLELDAERAKVKDLEAAAGAMSCKEIADKVAGYTQLQALVRAWGTAHESVDDWFRRAATDENTPTISEFEAVKKVLFDSERALKATLDATTPAVCPDCDGDGAVDSGGTDMNGNPLMRRCGCREKGGPMTDHKRAYLESVERQLWEMSQLAFERGEPWPLAEGPLTPNEATE